MLPNWDQVIHEPRTRELWWRGIAPRSRGVVWQRAVRNDLALTENSYRAALKRAKDAEWELNKKGQSSMAGHTQRERDWFNAIKRDAHTTFPELRIFQPEGPLHDSLVDVLMAYAMYRSDVGYIYGTHVCLSPLFSCLAFLSIFSHFIPSILHFSLMSSLVYSFHNPMVPSFPHLSSPTQSLLFEHTILPPSLNGSSPGNVLMKDHYITPIHKSQERN